MAVVAESKAHQEAWYDDMHAGKISQQEFAHRLDDPASPSTRRDARSSAPKVKLLPEVPPLTLPVFLSSPEGDDDAASAAGSGDESVKEVAAPGAITRVSSGAGASDREMVASKASPFGISFCFLFIHSASAIFVPRVLRTWTALLARMNIVASRAFIVVKRVGGMGRRVRR